MEAKAKSFAFIGNEGVVRIPFFQREYVWKKENWEELLLDLSNTDKSHFLGSLILKQQKTKSGEIKEVLVIDGQQRLTTISILIKSLYDSFDEKKKLNSKDSIRRHLFSKQYQTDEDYLIKIQHSQIDAKSFESIIRFGIDNDLPLSIEENTPSRILGCYSYFSTELAKKNDLERTQLFNAILDNENKIIVVIDLDENDNEQSIFDTINSAGVRLGCSDIVKNNLFQRVIQIKNQADAIKLYETTWKEVFLNDEETILFWEKQRLTGRLMRDNIDILLHSVAIIKGFYDPEKNSLSDLSNLYKEEIAKYENIEELKVFIEDLKKYATIFRYNILNFDKSTLFSFADRNQRLFHILDVLDISTFHPFILNILKKYSDDEESVARLFSQLECFIVRRIVSKQETKSFNKLCLEFIRNEKLLSEKLDELGEDTFEAGLKQVTNKVAALLLFWVELNRRSNAKYDITELKYDYSLEHIMPQKWEQFWKSIPSKNNPDGSKMELELSKKDRSEKIYWIGNMTLLKSSLNTSLRNFEFDRKIKGEGRKRGIIHFSELSITKDDIVQPYNRGDQAWDENKIINRTNLLFQEIKAIWSNK